MVSRLRLSMPSRNKNQRLPLAVRFVIEIHSCRQLHVWHNSILLLIRTTHDSLLATFEKAFLLQLAYKTVINKIIRLGLLRFRFGGYQLGDDRL